MGGILRTRLLALAASLAALVACADPPASNYPTQVKYVEDTSIGPGDVFDIRVFYGAKEVVRSYTVGSSGEIAFPFIGKVEVTGKNQSQVEEEIRSRLADGYLKDPVVSLDLKESNSKKVSVFGEVQKPGTLGFFDGMTVIEAISQAGGFKPLARRNAVTVTRVVEGKKVKYTVPVERIAQSKADTFPMRPGDVVFVPERAW